MIPVHLVGALTSCPETAGFLPYWPPFWIKPAVFHLYNQLLFARSNGGKHLTLPMLRPILCFSQEAMDRVRDEVLWQLLGWCERY
jgi:hypothetical protein